MKFQVSVVIPTYNGMSTLPALMHALRSQSHPVQIVCIDSSSSDGSDVFMRDKADVFVSIAKEDFNHGLTRNLGIERGSGELVMCTVQDALPTSARCVEHMVRALDSSEELAGVFARQVPQPDASAITRYYLSQWIASCSTGRTNTVSYTHLTLPTIDPVQISVGP